MFEELRPHLAELRKRLGLSVLSVFIAFIVTFTFHNTILTWITQPLNDALTQVGRIIESQSKTTWKMKTEEANQTKRAQHTKSPSTVAETLSGTLQEASQETQGRLAHLLTQAAKSAKELSVMLQTLENNRSNGLSPHNTFNGQITTHQVGGAFFVALKVSFFAALLLAMPFILWQLWLFVAPGLYSHEKKMVLPFVIGGSIMFLLGVLFAYYIVTPFGFQFLITFGSFLYTPLINIEDYVGFFTKIMMGFGLAFELPVFAYFLALLGLVTDRTLKDFFKYAIIIIFLIAALLTPPDVLTQLLMAAPLVILYGVSILIVAAVNPEQPEEEDGNDDTDASQKA